VLPLGLAPITGPKLAPRAPESDPTTENYLTSAQSQKRGEPPCKPGLGKMSAYKIINWRDRAPSSVEQTVVSFLEIGEAITTRWTQTAKGVLLLQMVPDNVASGAI
jgi:hypothetical protein